MKIPFEIINIEWKNLAEVNTEQIEKCLYCAYGDSPIYGQTVLLYIGIVAKQTLAARIEQHRVSDFSRINNLSYKVGILDNDVTQNPNFEEILHTAESILITMLKPSYNSSNIKSLNFNGNHYLLLNKGNRGALPLEVSNIWWKIE